MFKKIHEKLNALIREVDFVGDRLTVNRKINAETSFVMQKRLESIETWMELAVDTRADEVADRFDDLLREHSKKNKVTNQVLKDLVRQAVKGQ
jgi:hypothetical protein